MRSFSRDAMYAALALRCAPLMSGSGVLLVSTRIDAQAPAVRGSATGADRPLVVTLRKRAQYGGATDARLSLSRLYPGDVAAGLEGSMLVLDRDQMNVKRFDRSGRIIDSVGRRGSGPGEFRDPEAIAVGGDGAVYVADLATKRIVIFAKTVVRETSYEGLTNIDDMTATRDGRLFVAGRRADSAVVTQIGSGSSRRILSLPPQPKSDVRAFQRCGVREARAPLLSPSLITASNVGALAYTADPQFGVSLALDGRISQLKRERPPMASTSELLRRVLGDSIGIHVGASRQCTASVTDVAKDAGVAKFVPAYRRLALRASGEVWAVRSVGDSGSTLVDIYRGSSGYMGTARLPALTILTFLSDGALVALRHDDDDAPIVEVYDVTYRSAPASSTRAAREHGR